jgi:hypothetical protein
MSNRKGIVIPVVGTLLIVASIIYLFALTQAIETKQRTIMLKDELAISAENQAEMIRKFAELTFSSVSEDAVGPSCANIDNPSLPDAIRNRLQMGTTSLDKFRSVQWFEPNMTVTHTGGAASITGNQTFIFRDSRIGLSTNITMYYDEKFVC